MTAFADPSGAAMPLPPTAAGASQTVVLDGPAGAMEVVFDVPQGEARGVVIIGHPQPLMGGSAKHKIPQFLARGLQAGGWLAVRPNFRGVGHSVGVHDHGAGEADDVLWLVARMREHHAELRIALVGFSFGSFVLAQVAHRLASGGAPALAVALAGFPTGEVEAGRRYNAPPPAPNTLLVHGELDASVPLASVMAWGRQHAHPVMVVPGADHFFTGSLPLLRSLVLAHLAVAA